MIARAIVVGILSVACLIGCSPGKASSEVGQSTPLPVQATADAGGGGNTDGVMYAGAIAATGLRYSSAHETGLPSLNPDDYDRVFDGEYSSTFQVDDEYDNTLFIGCKFRNVDGHGMMISDVSNVTIYNCTFENISDTAILLKRSGSTNGVSIISNTFTNIGGDGIHSAKRFNKNVDHTDLLIYDNEIKNIGKKGGELYHGIYAQSTGVRILKNSITGFVDSNGISIRSDGVVWGNSIDITSGRDRGSGIKYYSDHESGPSSTLVIADNKVRGKNLYSGIELNIASQSIPKGVRARDWVVNNFIVVRNDVKAKNGYVIEKELKNASWSTVELSESPRSNRDLQWVVLP